MREFVGTMPRDLSLIQSCRNVGMQLFKERFFQPVCDSGDTESFSPTFALILNSKLFYGGFPRCRRASAVPSFKVRVVETYPLVLPSADLR